MQVINLQGDIITLSTARKEMQLLEVSMRAGKDTDPVFRHAADEATSALQQKMASILANMQGDSVEFSLSQREFMHISNIIEAVNTMDPEIYYPDMADEIPSDDELDEFTKHVSEIYDQAFKVG